MMSDEKRGIIDNINTKEHLNISHVIVGRLPLFLFLQHRILNRQKTYAVHENQFNALCEMFKRRFINFL